MTSDGPLSVGFLHLGRERSGLRRYGAILAAEASTRPGLEVVESEAGGRDSSSAQLRSPVEASERMWEPCGSCGASVSGRVMWITGSNTDTTVSLIAMAWGIRMLELKTRAIRWVR